jgi:sulfate adenylyltransferase subunit 1
LPLQYIAKEGDGTGHQPRTLWGRVAQGHVRPGDEVQVFPSGERARVVALRRAGADVTRAEAGQSAGVVLNRQLDVSRGDWIGAPGTLAATQRFGAALAWLDTEPAAIGRKYWLRHGNRWVQGRITAIDHVLDIHTLAPSDAHQLDVNEIGHVIIETQHTLPLQRYADNRVGGALIVVDATSNRTSGALLVEGVRA